MLKNTLTSYGFIAKSFHWLMALLLICMFCIAYVMINMSDSDFKFSIYDIHKATGLLLFGLVILRLTWRFINVQPVLSGIAKWQHFLAKSNLLVLYVLMFLMPITGFFMSTIGGHEITFYGLFTIQPLAHNKDISSIFAEAHTWVSYLLIGVFSLHVIGALYHHFILKDNVLRRIWVK